MAEFYITAVLTEGDGFPVEFYSVICKGEALPAAEVVRRLTELEEENERLQELLAPQQNSDGS